MTVLSGYQGADTDAEQLALTEQLFDAALGELGVVARTALLDSWGFQRGPTKILCLSEGISAGLWVDLEAAWVLARGFSLLSLASAGSTGRHRMDFMVGCTLGAAAVSACKVETGRWVAPHPAVRTHFDCGRWTCKVTQPVQRTRE